MKIVLDAEWKTKEGGHIVHDAEELHCISTKKLNEDTWFDFSDLPSDYSLNDFSDFIYECVDTIVCHNLIGADLQVFKNLLGINYTVAPKMTFMGKPITFIDTLSWSRRLYPDRPLPKGCPTSRLNPVTGKKDLVTPHGLDAWGYRVGIPKPKIDDWRNQPIETYLHRCKEDVKINELMYYKLLEEIE